MDQGSVGGLVDEDIGEGLNEEQPNFNTLVALIGGHDYGRGANRMDVIRGIYIELVVVDFEHVIGIAGGDIDPEVR